MKTGYDASEVGRLPDLLSEWSVKRLKAAGADAIKFLLYYDFDEDEKLITINMSIWNVSDLSVLLKIFHFSWRLLLMMLKMMMRKVKEYAKIKPHKVIEAMKEFSKSQYQVDVLKVEVPVDMNFVEGYTTGEFVYRKEEAAFFKEQSEVTELPFIFLSAGVSAKLFQETLKFAKEPVLPLTECYVVGQPGRTVWHLC